jgi:hypothetical protein
MTDGSGPTATDTIGGNDATLAGSAAWRTNVGTISAIGAGVDWIGSGEGPASVRGKVRQEVWGTRTAVKVETVDALRYVYEVSALGCDSVRPVVAGVRQDIADEVAIGPADDIYSVTLAPGEWAADTSGPTAFRLGAAPGGTVAADVVNGGTFASDGTRVLSAVLERVEVDLSKDVLDGNHIGPAVHKRPDPLGLVIDSAVTAGQPVEELLESMRAYLSTDPATWLLRLLLIDDPGAPVRTLTADDVKLSTVDVRGLGAPPEKTVRASYDPRGVTWDLGETSGLLDQNTRDGAARDKLDTGTVTTDDAVGLAIGTDRTWETLYATEQGARLASERRIATDGRQRATLSCRVLGRRDALTVGADFAVDLTLEGVNSTGVKAGSVWRLLRVTRPLALDALDCVFLGYQSSLGEDP